MKDVVGYNGKLSFDTTKPDGTPRKLIDVSRLSNMVGNILLTLKRDLKLLMNGFKELVND